MLWLCLHLPHLPLSALGAEADTPVVDQQGTHRWLITPAPQVEAGTPLARALMLQPALRTRARRVEAEQAALTSLAHLAYAYGQPVCTQIQDLREPGRLPRALLWVEIGQSLNLFGGLDALRAALCAELRELGHLAQLGVAPTRAAAALLAGTEPPEPVTALPALRAALDALPIQHLLWPTEILHALHGVGLRRLSELFDLPRDAFSKRFGARYRLALDQLLGLAPEPFEALVPPETFRRRFELAAEIEDTERLQFPLKRLCGELQAYLRARDRGLRSATLVVQHAGARETQFHAQFVDPHRDAQRIFDALKERLERDGLPLPARELLLRAEDFGEAHVPQEDLFDTRSGQSQRWSAALERLRARLGETRVWMPQALADHRPEYAMRCAPAPARAEPESLPPAPRPAFLLPEPWDLPAPALPEDAVFERIQSGWWDGDDIDRDYTVLEVNGARAWVYRERASARWKLHGWFS